MTLLMCSQRARRVCALAAATGAVLLASSRSNRNKVFAFSSGSSVGVARTTKQQMRHTVGGIALAPRVTQDSSVGHNKVHESQRRWGLLGGGHARAVGGIALAPRVTQDSSVAHHESQKRLVLVGGGHAHLQVIKALNCHSRPPNLDVTLIDVQSDASYSGMVPGCISRLYEPDETLIRLKPLARWAGIDFIQDAVVDVDPIRQRLVLASDDAEDVPYDAVSFDIGSASRDIDETMGAREFSIPTRPISDLVDRIEKAEEGLLRERMRAGDEGRVTGDVHLVVIGGGAAGIELSLAMKARWGPLFCQPHDGMGSTGANNKGHSGGQALGSLRVTLLDAGHELLPSESKPCRDAVKNTLSRRGILVRHDSVVASVAKDTMVLTDGEVISYTHCIWATGAASHPLASALRNQGVAVTDRGWIRVDPSLKSISHPSIFAAGDCASIEGLPGRRPSPPKAGVYAVRAGPTLIENLVRYLAGRAELKPYVPQDDFLKLLVCGDGTALGFRFGIPIEGPWVWKLKDRIDKLFMGLFAEENLPVLEDTVPYDTSQYDAVKERPERLDPNEAAWLLQRTDEGVDYERAWNVLRDMMESVYYKQAVLKVVKAQSLLVQ